MGCSIIGQETYKGVLLGDVNGNFSTVGSGGSLRQNSANRVIFDLTKATLVDGYFEVPVSVVSDEEVNSLDFAMDFSNGNLEFNSVVDHSGYLQSLSNLNSDDKTLRFTSYSLQNYEMNKSLISIRVSAIGGKLDESDFSSLECYLNGEKVNAELLTARNSSISSNNQQVDVYPNPTNGLINVLANENAIVQLMDINGSVIYVQTSLIAGQKQEVNLQSLANGIYMIKVYNENFVSLKKVVVNK